MKNPIFNVKIFIVFFLAIVVGSCTGEDGPIGPVGPEGPAGVDGIDGVDGNANVRTLLIEILPTDTGSSVVKDVPELTQEVIDNDLVLGYLMTLEGTLIPIPTINYLQSGGGRNFINISVEVALGRFWMYFHEPGSNAVKDFAPEYVTHLKIIIVKSTDVSSKTGAAKLRAQMKKDGVDVMDYNAVIDYFQYK